MEKFLKLLNEAKKDVARAFAGVDNLPTDLNIQAEIEKIIQKVKGIESSPDKKDEHAKSTYIPYRDRRKSK